MNCKNRKNRLKHREKEVSLSLISVSVLLRTKPRGTLILTYKCVIIKFPYQHRKETMSQHILFRGNIMMKILYEPSKYLVYHILKKSIITSRLPLMTLILCIGTLKVFAASTLPNENIHNNTTNLTSISRAEFVNILDTLVNKYRTITSNDIIKVCQFLNTEMIGGKETYVALIYEKGLVEVYNSNPRLFTQLLGLVCGYTKSDLTDTWLDTRMLQILAPISKNADIYSRRLEDLLQVCSVSKKGILNFIKLLEYASIAFDRNPALFQEIASKYNGYLLSNALHFFSNSHVQEITDRNPEQALNMFERIEQELGHRQTFLFSRFDTNCIKENNKFITQLHKKDNSLSLTVGICPTQPNNVMIDAYVENPVDFISSVKILDGYSGPPYEKPSRAISTDATLSQAYLSNKKLFWSIAKNNPRNASRIFELMRMKKEIIRVALIHPDYFAQLHNLEYIVSDKDLCSTYALDYFEKYPDRYVIIANSSRKSLAIWMMKTLENEVFASAYYNAPEKTIELLDSLAYYVQPSQFLFSYSYDLYSITGSTELSKLFMQHPHTFFEIAKFSSTGFLNYLEDQNSEERRIFEKHIELMVELAKASKQAFNTNMMLLSEIDNYLDQNPNAFHTLFIAASNSSKIIILKKDGSTLFSNWDAQGYTDLLMENFLSQPEKYISQMLDALEATYVYRYDFGE